MRHGSRFVVAGCALALLVFVVYPRRQAPSPRTGPTPDEARAEPPSTSSGSPELRVESVTAKDLAERHLDPVKREQMRALIWQAIGRPSPPPAPQVKRRTEYVLPARPPWEVGRRAADEAGSPPVTGRIDPVYIQDRVREDFFPLALKCYQDGVAQDPSLAGTMHLAFNIVGDEKTGGIVEAVDVLDKSTLRDPEVIDCMRQSFLSITFRPPADGGEVTVIYPIDFSNDDAG
jgi:hypothetical protein